LIAIILLIVQASSSAFDFLVFLDFFFFFLVDLVLTPDIIEPERAESLTEEVSSPPIVVG
jgi:hypothetical protein